MYIKIITQSKIFDCVNNFIFVIIYCEISVVLFIITCREILSQLLLCCRCLIVLPSDLSPGTGWLIRK